jgi:UDP-N-acetylglucosamine:LPS N-acetylglucosamine transferase
MSIKKPKILAIASPGGHWIQLNKICNPLEDRFDVVYVTPAAQYTSGKKSSRKILNITDASATSKLKLIPLAFQLLGIFIAQRPKAIISTGAAPGAIAFLLAKFLPIQTIWVDSIANVSQLSRSARMVKNHADLLITQWEALSDGDKIIYKGSIL